jgi:hypothetical protein
MGKQETQVDDERQQGRAEQRQRWFERLTRHRPAIVALSALVSAAIVVPLALTTGTLRPFDIVGFGATVWALVLAVVIYLVTAESADARNEKYDAAVEQLASLVEGPAYDQTPEERDQKLVEFQDYADALVAEYPMPQSAIVFIDRAPQQGVERNRPVVVHTRRGREYSIFHGGRHGGYTVTKLRTADS